MADVTATELQLTAFPIAADVAPTQATAERSRVATERLIALWGVAVPLALLDGLHWYLRVPPVTWPVILMHVATCCLLYPSLIALAPSLISRFPLEVEGWPKRVAIHLLAALTFQYIHFELNHLVLLGLVRPVFLHPTSAARLYFPGLPPQHFREYPIDLLAYWMIVGFFYASRYYFESHDREMAAARLETTLAEARLELLRRQLSPHFLFNTLNTISVLALRGDQTAVANTIQKLSELLRVAIDESNPQLVALAEELRFLDGYLSIQQIRFADQLNIQLDIAPESLRAVVPFMILQPVIENAIEHGMSTNEDTPSTVTIRSAIESGRLRLTVSDTGPGFLRRRGQRRVGIGLANTESRLQQLYGDDHVIDYGGSASGASVTMAIPFVPLEAMD
jgi:hypothetical protein